jgi:hypothetical protein
MVRMTEIHEVIRLNTNIDDLERIKVWYDGFKKAYYQSKKDEELMAEIDQIIAKHKGAK